MNIFEQFPTGHAVEGPHPQNCSAHWQVEKARIFMIAAHEAVGQRRKYTNELYAIHPMEVAAKRATRPNATIADIVACILHDVIEDTGITRELIASEFGEEVADLVVGMTDVSKLEDGVRAIRRGIDNRHVLGLSNRIKANKLCDIDHNIRNIARLDPGFARKYLPEKMTQMIDGQMRDADPELYDANMAFIQDYMDSKGIVWKPTSPEVIAAVDAYYAALDAA